MSTEPGAGHKAYFRKAAEKYDLTSLLIGDSFLGRMIRGLRGDAGAAEAAKIEFFCVPFARNLQVSCCGCFHQETSVYDSVIAYNLISYADMSILVLTSFRSAKQYFDAFLKEYHTDSQRLLNELAFMKSEEPLIGAKLWRSLSEAQQLEIRLSLCHPDFRAVTAAPQIVRLAPGDGFSAMTPELWNRLRLVDQK